MIRTQYTTCRPSNRVFPQRYFSPAIPLRLGDLLSGRYRILALTHQGEGWRMYQAKDAWSGKLMTIKQMSRLAGRREAHLLKGLSHPVLPMCHRVFYRGQAAYLILEEVKGKQLHMSLLERRGPAALTIVEVLDIGRQLADLLVYLHGQRPRVITLNLWSLAHVLRRPDGRLHLTDFSQVRRCRLSTRGIPGSGDVAQLRSALVRLLPESVPGEFAWRVYGRPDLPSSAGSLRAALDHLMTLISARRAG